MFEQHRADYNVIYFCPIIRIFIIFSFLDISTNLIFFFSSVLIFPLLLSLNAGWERPYVVWFLFGVSTAYAKRSKMQAASSIGQLNAYHRSSVRRYRAVAWFYFRAGIEYQIQGLRGPVRRQYVAGIQASRSELAGGSHGSVWTCTIALCEKNQTIETLQGIVCVPCRGHRLRPTTGS